MSVKFSFFSCTPYKLFYFELSVIVMWLCCLYAHFDIKFMHVDSILTDIFEKYIAQNRL